MANTSNPCGLKPLNQPFGAIRCTCYKAVTGIVGGLFMYSPVDINSNGYVTVASATSGNNWVGSVIGMLAGDYGPMDSTYPYSPANPRAADVDSEGYINVIVADDPEQKFVIEESSGTALTAASRFLSGSFAWFAGADSGNTKTGISKCVLDGGKVSASGSANQLMLIDKLDKPDNAFGSYCKWIVKPLYHRYKPLSMTDSTV